MERDCVLGSRFLQGEYGLGFRGIHTCVVQPLKNGFDAQQLPGPSGVGVQDFRLRL